MKLITDTSFSAVSSAVSFGRFDGLHLGHQAVLSMLDSSSKGLEQIVVELTAGAEIYTAEEKSGMLGDRQTLMSFRDTPEICEADPEQIVKNIFVDQLGVQVIVSGENIRFGRERSGDFRLLEKLSVKYGFRLVSVPVVMHSGLEISSERIRAELTAGNLDAANSMLGRPYRMSGPVVHGKALGRTVGMPTANISYSENTFLPRHGVYGTRASIDGKVVYGLTSVGTRPTVDHSAYPTIETYFMDFSDDLYDRALSLEFLVFIRDIFKYPDLQAVMQQVRKDDDYFRNYLKSSRA